MKIYIIFILTSNILTSKLATPRKLSKAEEAKSITNSEYQKVQNLIASNFLYSSSESGLKKMLKFLNPNFFILVRNNLDIDDFFNRPQDVIETLQKNQIEFFKNIEKAEKIRTKILSDVLGME